MCENKEVIFHLQPWMVSKIVQNVICLVFITDRCMLPGASLESTSIHGGLTTLSPVLKCIFFCREILLCSARWISILLNQKSKKLLMKYRVDHNWICLRLIVPYSTLEGMNLAR